MNNGSRQMDKARLGAIGENNVVSMLMQHGWSAFNANCSIKNYKSIDVVCINSDVSETDKPWKPKTSFVQVKTSVQSNIPIGFTIDDCLKKDELEKKVMGPYVFVSTTVEDGTYKFRYFILTRKQFIELAHQAHWHYKYGYKRDKGINPLAPAGLYVRWLEGRSDPETKKHDAFINPLKGESCENKWENIWKDE